MDKKANNLYQKFKEMPNVSRIESTEDEAFILSLSLVDIENSAKEIISLIKKIEKSTSTTDENIETLAEIGEELRHIIYHVSDCKYYDYIMLDDFK